MVFVGTGRNPWLVSPTTAVARPSGAAPLLEGTVEIPSSHPSPSVPRLIPVIPCGFGGGGARRRNLPGGVVWLEGCRCAVLDPRFAIAAGVRVTTWFPAMPGLPFSVWCLLAVPCSPVLGSLEPGWKRKGFPFLATEPWQLNEHQGHFPRILCMICFPVVRRKLDASSAPMCRFL